MSKLVHSPAGNYSFLAAEGRPYSAGMVADAGYDLVHATFEFPLPLEAGLAAAERHVSSAGRPVQAIGGFELRIPEPLTPSGFAEFNKGYVARLTKLGLVVDGLMPAARTNVAPVTGRVTEPSVYGFTYTVSGGHGRRAFLLSGVPEEKAADPGTMIDSMMRILSGRLQEMEASWQDATVVQLYGVDDIQNLLIDRVLRHLGAAAVHGIHWFPSLPPIEGLELELDARSAKTELLLAPNSA